MIQFNSIGGIGSNRLKPMQVFVQVLASFPLIPLRALPALAGEDRVALHQANAIHFAEPGTTPPRPATWLGAGLVYFAVPVTILGFRKRLEKDMFESLWRVKQWVHRYI